MLLLFVACTPDKADTDPAPSGDTAGHDSAGPEDTGDTGTPDDTAPETGDTGPVETGDTGPDDTGPVDTGERTPVVADLATVARFTVAGSEVDDAAGGSAVVVAPDVDGDGAGELFVGVIGREFTSSTSGGVMRVGLPLDRAREWDDADSTYGGEVDSRTGASIAVGDLDGDGLTDLVTGVPGANDFGNTRGGIAVWLGPAEGGASAADADVYIRGDVADNLGSTVALAGDLDGAGGEDIVTGGYQAAWVFPGPLDAGTTRDDGWAVSCDSDAIPAVAGEDLDGDGLVDLALGCRFSSGGAPDGGGVYVWSGPLDGPRGPADADALLYGATEDGMAGTQLVSSGDRDGDGHVDLAVGVPRDPGVAPRLGAVYLPRGPFAGTSRLADADDRLLGAGAAVDDPTTGLGYGGLAFGDVDGDGARDLLAGATGIGPTEAGGAALFYGPLDGVIAYDTAAFTWLADGDRRDEAGGAVALGDVDLDGLLDVLVGASRAEIGGVSVGAVYVIPGVDLLGG